MKFSDIRTENDFTTWLTGHNKNEETFLTKNGPLTDQTIDSFLGLWQLSSQIQEQVNAALTALNNVNGVKTYLGGVSTGSFEGAMEDIISDVENLAALLAYRADLADTYSKATGKEKLLATLGMVGSKAGEGFLSVLEDIGDGIFSIAGGIARENSTFAKTMKKWIKKEWSHDAFNFYYDSDLAKKSTFTENSAIANTTKFAGEIGGWVVLGGAVSGAAKGFNATTTVGKGLAKTLSSSTRVNTITAALAGDGSKTELELARGKSLNEASWSGVKAGAVQGAVAYGIGKAAEKVQANKAIKAADDDLAAARDTLEKAEKKVARKQELLDEKKTIRDGVQKEIDKAESTAKKWEDIKKNLDRKEASYDKMADKYTKAGEELRSATDDLANAKNLKAKGEQELFTATVEKDPVAVSQARNKIRKAELEINRLENDVIPTKEAAFKQASSDFKGAITKAENANPTGRVYGHEAGEAQKVAETTAKRYNTKAANLENGPLKAANTQVSRSETALKNATDARVVAETNESAAVQRIKDVKSTNYQGYYTNEKLAQNVADNGLIRGTAKTVKDSAVSAVDTVKAGAGKVASGVKTGAGGLKNVATNLRDSTTSVMNNALHGSNPLKGGLQAAQGGATGTATNISLRSGVQAVKDAATNASEKIISGIQSATPGTVATTAGAGVVAAYNTNNYVQTHEVLGSVDSFGTDNSSMNYDLSPDRMVDFEDRQAIQSLQEYDSQEKLYQDEMAKADSMNSNNSSDVSSNQSGSSNSGGGYSSGGGSNSSGNYSNNDESAFSESEYKDAEEDISGTAKDGVNVDDSSNTYIDENGKEVGKDDAYNDVEEDISGTAKDGVNVDDEEDISGTAKDGVDVDDEEDISGTAKDGVDVDDETEIDEEKVKMAKDKVSSLIDSLKNKNDVIENNEDISGTAKDGVTIEDGDLDLAKEREKALIDQLKNNSSSSDSANVNTNPETNLNDKQTIVTPPSDTSSSSGTTYHSGGYTPPVNSSNNNQSSYVAPTPTPTPEPEPVQEPVVETPTPEVENPVEEVVPKESKVTKIPTVTPSTPTKETSGGGGGSRIIPIAAGIGAAAAAGLGAKAYLDRKENTDNGEDDEWDTEVDEGDKPIDINYDNKPEEGESVLEDDDEYTTSDEEEIVERYDARANDELADLQ